MPPKITPQQNFKNKVFTLAKTAQLYWFIGHILAVVFFFASLLFRFISQAKEKQFYKLSILSELASYGCVLKQLPTGSFRKIQVMKNESVQYFAFALVMFVTSFKLNPWTIGLTSFIIYSFFHSITYFRANFLDFMPLSLQTKADISQKITFIASNYNEQALYFASFSEISLLQNLLWDIPSMLFKLRSDPSYVFYNLINYAALVVFLKLRYDDSRYTKTAVEVLDQKINTTLSNQIVPPQASHFYNEIFKVQAKRLVGHIQVPNTKSVKKSQ